MSSIFDNNPTSKTQRKLNLQEFWKRLDAADRETRGEHLLRHFSQVLRYIAMRPFAFVFTILTAALALTVFACVLVLAFGSQSLLSQQGADVQASIFLRDSAGDADITALQKTILSYAGVESVSLTSKEQALDHFKAVVSATNDSATGGVTLGDISGSNNPLPRSLELTLATKNATDTLAKLKNDLQSNTAVELMQFSATDFNVAATLGSALERAIIIVVPLGIVLVGFLIATTVRLSVAASIDEIHTMWILGARRRFVYTPFLLHALLQGLLAGIAALLMTFSIQSTVANLWNESFTPLGIHFTFDTRTNTICILILCSSLGASFVAALLALHNSTRDAR